MILMDSQSNNGVKSYKQQTRTMSSIRYNLDNEEKEDDLTTIRKKMHKLLKQNFELKEENSKLKSYITAFEKQTEIHRQNMRCLLDEVSQNDKQKQIMNKNLKEFQGIITKQQMEIAYAKQQSESQKHQIDHLLQLNKNLETENKMVISIKNKYSLDVAKLKIELENQKKINEQIIIQHNEMSAEIKILVEDIGMLQDQLNRRGNQVRNYQQKSAERQFIVKNDRENQQKTEEEMKKLKQKCQKYKRKCQTYKQERDELAMQISRANQQIDSHTLRKYFQE